MKFDCLTDVSLPFPLLRLYDFSPAEAGQLQASMIALGCGAEQRIQLHGQPFVVPIGECELTLIRRAWDQGVLQKDALKFECGFTEGRWEDIAGLIEPFAEGCGGFQWLAGSCGEPALLLSATGCW